MPAHPKPGIDWPSVKARFLAGESVNQIALSYDGLISRQAIDKRARKEGWAARALATIRRNQAVVDQRGRRTSSNRTALISLIADGISLAKACRSIGFNEATFRAWLADDPEFDAEFNAARLEWERARTANIARAEARGDWKASAYRLEKHEFTRAEYAHNDHTNTSISVILNMPEPGERGPSVTIEALEDGAPPASDV